MLMDGRWTFHAGTANATLEIAEDRTPMPASWTVQQPDGRSRSWMELRFTRQRPGHSL
jgi:hypothetical protein